MLLAAVNDLRVALGFDDDNTDFTAAATHALHAAEAALQSILGTRFDRETRFDLFFLSEPGYTEPGLAVTEFRLRRGFIQTLSSLRYAGSVTALDDDFLVPDSTILDGEKGVLTDYTTVYNRSYVRVAYTAGFEADTTDTESYDLSQVPQWLQEAAKLQTMLLLASSPPLTQAKVELDTKLIGATLRDQLNSKVRYTPVAKLPL